ncbi:unnamed protein product [Peniophora sp. CBMAI 1063]|nr:unnamed protein product [Peniophora sp. CBMAI 1063]
MPHDVHGKPVVAAAVAGALFVFMLLGFVVESELTQYVQTSLGYRQPFFLFYVVHSAFIAIFPAHFLYLVLIRRHSPRALLTGLSQAIKGHLAPKGTKRASALTGPFPSYKFFRLAALCTLGATVPALLWFGSISLASISDVTAIWNTNAFFAYVFTVRLYKLRFERRKLSAVLLATIGVLLVVYGGASAGEPDETAVTKRTVYSAPLLGDVLTLIASVGYGLYQVMYKRHAALPSDPEPLITDPPYERLSIDSDVASLDSPARSTHSLVPTPATEDVIEFTAAVPPPFGLHPNLLTSAIGLCTLVLLAPLVPLLDWAGYEEFRPPPNAWTTLSIAGIAASGVVFNSGLMVLLNVWGPIVVSVGNLLTIVLVFIADIFFGAGASAVTLGSVLGSGCIIGAFGILVFDMLRPAAA